MRSYDPGISKSAHHVSRSGQGSPREIEYLRLLDTRITHLSHIRRIEDRTIARAEKHSDGRRLVGYIRPFRYILRLELSGQWGEVV